MDNSTTPREPHLDKNTNHGCSGVSKIFIPDLLRASQWPWSRQTNPHYAEFKEESDAWLVGLQPYSPKVQKFINGANYSLVVGLALPTSSREHARAACDLMHFLFVVDDYCEKSAPSEVRKKKEIILDAFRNPRTPRPKEEPIFGEMARQFWVNNMQNVREVTLKRFLWRFDDYMEGIVEETINKEQRRILDVESYIRVRRRTVAGMPFFSMIELGFDFPDEVMSLPAIREMELGACDIVACSNDIFSYNVEQMRGDDLHNIITSVMNEHHTDVNGAILWIQDHVSGLAEKFLATMASLPQWEEPLNSQVKGYCNALGQLVRGNQDWSFEGGRYFGRKGQEIRKNKWMSLLPKTASDEFGPVKINDSIL